jgi:hypothetical protein
MQNAIETGSCFSKLGGGINVTRGFPRQPVILWRSEDFRAWGRSLTILYIVSRKRMLSFFSQTDRYLPCFLMCEFASSWGDQTINCEVIELVHCSEQTVQRTYHVMLCRLYGVATWRTCLDYTRAWKLHCGISHVPCQLILDNGPISWCNQFKFKYIYFCKNLLFCLLCYRLYDCPACCKLL